MYILVGGPKTRAFRVLWMLEEVGVTYDYHPEQPRSDAVRAVNPAGKVPILIDGGVPITDSTAILTYLADKHGVMTHTAGTLERARQDSLTQFLLDEFDANLWTAARHSFILPKELRIGGIKDTLRWEFERSQKALVQRMSGPFVAGDQMTVPDIILTHCGTWAENASFEITEPDLAAYLGRMRERPAYQRSWSIRQSM